MFFLKKKIIAESLSLPASSLTLGSRMYYHGTSNVNLLKCDSFGAQIKFRI